MSNYHFVTSFNSRIWEKYANKTISSFINEYADKPEEGFEFIFWMDNEHELKDFITMNNLGEKFKFASLDQVPHYVDFSRRFGDDIPMRERQMDKAKIPEGMQFRFNYMPFAKKIFSWIAVYQNIPENDYMVWYDCDILLNRRFTKENMDQVIQDFDVVFLDRDFPWYAAETGFFALKKCPAVDNFVNLILAAYMTGFIFDMAEWHDGYIFKTMLKLAAGPSLRVLSLTTTPKERDIFERTMLADWMVHFKGGNKNKLRDDMDDVGKETLINFDPSEQ